MLCILAEADLRAVQKDGAFYQKYANVLNEGYKEISTLINKEVSAA